MKRNSNPVITVKQIRSLRPNEYIEVRGVDKKRRSVISSMIDYVKTFGLPRYVAHIACMCKGDVCKIVALPRGKSKKDWVREHQKSKDHDYRA